jgi:hypothetical protein
VLHSNIMTNLRTSTHYIRTDFRYTTEYNNRTPLRLNGTPQR